ncbi:TEA-domain-containing protein [Ascobolus immersus RN42]|uniref:TEA-domain-containing protein n=1 Tax=Ascobolus immersus RN42 TaxID=1160509 RepID=A0A3N4I5E7_ASCIM|nr:TEA-domain-containing protein [Ascobolus immersus RN42]
MSSQEQHCLPVTRSNIEKLQALTLENSEQHTQTNDFEMDSQYGSGLSAYEEYRLRIRREGEEYQESLRRGAGFTEAKEPVWDDELEEAFHEAIRTIPIIGKTKLQLNGKQCGRNELISDYIYRTTGRLRTRKQISSHIQVLKHLLSNDAEFIKFVNNSKPVERKQKSHGSETSRSASKVTKRPYHRRAIKQEQSRSPSPFVGTPSPYYGSPAPEEMQTYVYDDEMKWAALPELLYQQTATYSDKLSFYPFSLDNTSNYSQQSWTSVTSAPANPAMRTAIDPALTSAMDPTLTYLPSTYSEVEHETDDEFEAQYYATPGYPWDAFTTQV